MRGVDRQAVAVLYKQRQESGHKVTDFKVHKKTVKVAGLKSHLKDRTMSEEDLLAETAANDITSHNIPDHFRSFNPVATTDPSSISISGPDSRPSEGDLTRGLLRTTVCGSASPVMSISPPSEPFNIVNNPRGTTDSFMHLDESGATEFHETLDGAHLHQDTNFDLDWFLNFPTTSHTDSGLSPSVSLPFGDADFSIQQATALQQVADLSDPPTPVSSSGVHGNEMSIVGQEVANVLGSGECLINIGPNITEDGLAPLESDAQFCDQVQQDLGQLLVRGLMPDSWDLSAGIPTGGYWTFLNPSDDTGISSVLCSRCHTQISNHLPFPSEFLLRKESIMPHSMFFRGIHLKSAISHDAGLGSIWMACCFGACIFARQ